ncbi:MAG: hypothetical protein K6T59_12195, partial [Bryobacteraceae bacterium]|nr:hypothetical protein [Bryobacteraceae bacterium]
MKVAIVCDWFFWLDGSRLGTGGVETYLQNLIRLIRQHGCEVAVFQRGIQKFSTAWESCPVQSWRSFEEQKRLLQAYHGGRIGPTIYSDFHVIGPAIFRPCVVIQHGVYWDVRYRRFRSTLLQWLLNIKKSVSPLLLSRRLLRQIRHVDKVITVDTNFQNWMRSMCTWADLEAKWLYVPNFAEPYPELLVQRKLCADRPIRKILFARRFEAFRGTWLWTRVVKRIAPHFPDIKFCFCGHGQMKGSEMHLRQELDSLRNVLLYERAHEEMAEEHYAADIE